jgi:hypothetical protein
MTDKFIYTLEYVDGDGKQKVRHIGNEGGGQIGYAFEETKLRIWTSTEGGSHQVTRFWPIDRVVELEVRELN